MKMWQLRWWPPLPRRLWAYTNTANTVLFVWTSRETIKRWRRHSWHVPLRFSFCTLGSWPRPREPQSGPEEVPVLWLQRLPQRQALSRQSHPRPQARRVNESFLSAYMHTPFVLLQTLVFLYHYGHSEQKKSLRRS